MRNFFVCLLACIAIPCYAQHLPATITLPNGWKLSPAGTSMPLGDLPLNIAVGKAEKYMAVLNCGQGTQTLQLIDVKRQQVLDTVIIPKCWYGLAFTADGDHLFVSGGNDNIIWKFNVEHRKLQLEDSIILGNPWPVKISPAGIAVNRESTVLYVVTKENKKLYRVDLPGKVITDSLPLGGEGYACILSPSGNELYVSCWGCKSVKVFDVNTRKFTQSIAVGDHPNEMVVTRDGRYMFVCNAMDNTVSVIDLTSKKVMETLNAAMYPGALPGSGTNCAALDEKEKTLYVANADNNNLAVFDVSHPGSSRGKGFIPVGWYPTNVKCIGRTIYVANGKGFTSLANPGGPSPMRPRQSVSHHGWGVASGEKVQYIGSLFRGTMSIISMPGEKLLKEYTTACYRNLPDPKERETATGNVKGNPVPSGTGQKSPIRYVFYVIKENRTYDQVLADAPGGDGDTSLLLFGEGITPNQHRIVKDFVLLDHFFVDAEVSADGHNWSMGAYANDYLEKTWPTNYGGRGGTYDAEGNRPIANNKAFIWDMCKMFEVPYRTYGEFTERGRASIPSLKEHFCKSFSGFDLSIKDTLRYRQWEHDFDSLLAIGKVPRFNSVRFGNDHTEGLKWGKYSPFALVADNDMAVGMFIEHLSRSPIWNETAVFILEDDAQNGADHVDAHRSTAYLAGGFVKRGLVDHTPYTTSSVLRTMELILGLPPMTQFDASATALWRCFDTVARSYTFRSIVPAVNMNERNTAMNQWQKISEKFNMANEDAVPDRLFNEVLWHAIKGETAVLAPVHAAYLRPEQKSIDD